MKTKLFLAFAIVMSLAIGQAGAQVRTERAQKARIAHGVRSGKLTGPEAHRLFREQRHIHRSVRRAKWNDGRIGPRERRHIRREKRRAGHHIYRFKHNRFHRS